MCELKIFFFQALRKKMQQMLPQMDWSLLRKICLLSLLPPNLIKPTFNELKDSYCDEANKVFFAYYESFWLRKVCLFFFEIHI